MTAGHAERSVLTTVLPDDAGATGEDHPWEWLASLIRDQGVTVTAEQLKAVPYDENEERARRLETLQRAESEFDPVPFGADAARAYGRVTASVIATGRKPRRRIADLMIAATAIAEGLPLFTTNPGDYAGLDKLIRVVPVVRPPLPHGKDAM
jgi:predicted nucleic acid-binding protein